MEISDSVIVNKDQLEWISKEKKNLESRFQIKICFPPATFSSIEMAVKDIIFISICGVKSDVEKAKKRLFQEALKSNTKTLHESENVPLVVLSDSEDDEIHPAFNDEINDDVQVVSASAISIKSDDIVLKQARLDNPKKIELPDYIPIWFQEKKVPKRMLSRARKVTAPVCKDGRQIEQTDVFPTCKHPQQVSIPISKPITDPTRLRPIIVDASNVARAHGKQQTPKTFSCRGIQICVQYFLKRKHSVKAFIPNNMRYWKNTHDKSGIIMITDRHLLEEMSETGHIVYTPCRTVQKKMIVCYDDRFMINYASETGGVIVSNDNYRDLMVESETFKKTIEERLLMFCWADDVFMPAQDPLGRTGPNLNEFLSFPAIEQVTSQENQAPQEQGTVADKVNQKRKGSSNDEIDTLHPKKTKVTKLSKNRNTSDERDVFQVHQFFLQQNKGILHKKGPREENTPINGNSSEVQNISSGEEDCLPGDESVLIIEDDIV